MTSIRRALPHLISPRAFAIAALTVAVLVAGFLSAVPANAAIDEAALDSVARVAPLLALFVVLAMLCAVALRARRSSH